MSMNVLKMRKNGKFGKLHASFINALIQPFFRFCSGIGGTNLGERNTQYLVNPGIDRLFIISGNFLFLMKL